MGSKADDEQTKATTSDEPESKDETAPEAADGDKPTDKDTQDTSAIIAEAAAAAVAAAVNVEDADVTAAALAVKTEEETHAKKNEQRRKRYREKTVEEEAAETKPSKKTPSHEDQLAARRLKDRQRYANMTPEQRQVYNSKRRYVCQWLLKLADASAREHFSHGHLTILPLVCSCLSGAIIGSSTTVKVKTRGRRGASVNEPDTIRSKLIKPKIVMLVAQSWNVNVTNA